MPGFIFDKNCAHIAHPYHAVKHKWLIFAKENIVTCDIQSECTKRVEAKCVFHSFFLHSLTEVTNLEAKLLCTARKSDPFFLFTQAFKDRIPSTGSH